MHLSKEHGRKEPSLQEVSQSTFNPSSFVVVESPIYLERNVH